MKKKVLFKLRKIGVLDLVDSNENVQLAYLKKSDSNWESAVSLFEINKIEEAIAILYYSAYNSILSLLFGVGIKSENHDASIFLLKEVFGINDFLISALKKERISVQYYIGFELKKKDVEDLFFETSNFNSFIRDFISRLNNEKINEYRTKFDDLFIKNA